MQTDLPIQNLLGSVIELRNDVSEIRHYLNRGIAKNDKIYLPLGAMGQIMVRQLQTESNVLADQVEKLDASASSWNMTQHFLTLNRKVALLMTLAGMIAQLPSATPKARATAGHLARRVIEQCVRLERIIEAAAAAAAVVSNPAPVNA